MNICVQLAALCQRVIFLTGDSSAADHAAFLGQCGQPWLSKPYPIAALRHAMQQVLSLAVRAQQLRTQCQALRQRSQALCAKVQRLCARSAHVRCQGALLRGKVRVYDRPMVA